MGACLDKLLRKNRHQPAENENEKSAGGTNRVIYEFEKYDALCSIMNGDLNYALSSVIQVFLEIEAFRRFYVLERRHSDQLFLIMSKIFDQALKQSVPSGALLTVQDQSKSEVDIENDQPSVNLKTVNLQPLIEHLQNDFKIDRKHNVSDILKHLLNEMHAEIVKRDLIEE